MGKHAEGFIDQAGPYALLLQFEFWLEDPAPHIVDGSDSSWLLRKEMI